MPFVCTSQKLFVTLQRKEKNMAKSFYFVVQSWMLEDMKLPLADAAVYAYIHGLTNSEELGKQGWHGSKRRLAKVLHVSPSTMNDIVNRLEEKGFLHFANGFITSTINRDIVPRKVVESAAVQNPDTFEDKNIDGVPF